MISIIISSANPAFLQQVTKNINDTIGITHEIIATDNSNGQRGICQVYNEGVAKAKYDLLCFMHEDILIKTSNWGSVVADTFNNYPKLGLIGLVGSAYKPLAPSGWGGVGPHTHYTNIIQSYQYSDKQPEHQYRNPADEKLSRVACVDGVWFCTTKNIATQYPFDEQNFTGFHAYDIDFSLLVGQKYTICVIYDVLIEHFSEGNYNKTWLLDTLKLHEKWNSQLPVNYSSLTGAEVIYTEKATFKYFIKYLSTFGLPISYARKMLHINNRYLKLNFKLYLKLQFYILLQSLKSKRAGV
ncbi:glycosyltransferase family protein [Mucilaginibacter dorajii]|uniref:Streptomycin biosynthesis protein StrF domain-containing protein n=1 Tax=Mucilaginibacter dorajii TaxID=692994 RepID=A0ABP7Q5U3_9SPHI|nr:glycosyltransferase family protein [Mucilaginibacter dorajii]MCS3737841.1 glycosyltransferase involved in cell wall biosynthesis [Mucilaginibacter dorajii]